MPPDGDDRADEVDEPAGPHAGRLGRDAVDHSLEPDPSADQQSEQEPGGELEGTTAHLDPESAGRAGDVEVGNTSKGDPRARKIRMVSAAVMVAIAVLAGGILFASRNQSVVTTVAHAEAIPSPTEPAIETTTTETVVQEEAPPDPGPDPTSEPSDQELEQIRITLPRPSTVLTGSVNGPLPIFDAPGGRAVRTLPNPRAINGDPNASVPLVLLAKQRQGDWYEVWLPIRPNGSTGWVRKSDFKVTNHNFLIEVRLSQYNLKVYDGDKLIMNTAIGVATNNTPTPGGLYYIIELLAPPNPNGPYGPYAYGLSGYSNVHRSFAGGPGQLGMHGTNQPGGIGRQISNGCIRMRNQDITTLAKTLPLGVPVIVLR